MGDSFVYFASRDPHFAPAPEAIGAACGLVRRAIAKQDGFEAKVTDRVEFFVNYEGGFKARCPRCMSAQPEAELMAWIGHDYREGAGFALAPRAMACCGATLNLNELDYDPPAAFARFAIKLQNVRWGFEDDLPTAPAWRGMKDEYRAPGAPARSGTRPTPSSSRKFKRKSSASRCASARRWGRPCAWCGSRYEG